MKLTFLILAAVAFGALTTGRLLAPDSDRAPSTAFDLNVIATVEITEDSSSLRLVGWLGSPHPQISDDPLEQISIRSVHRFAMTVLRFTLRDVLGIRRGEA